MDDKNDYNSYTGIGNSINPNSVTSNMFSDSCSQLEELEMLFAQSKADGAKVDQHGIVNVLPQECNLDYTQISNDMIQSANNNKRYNQSSINNLSKSNINGRKNNNLSERTYPTRGNTQDQISENYQHGGNSLSYSNQNSTISSKTTRNSNLINMRHDNDENKYFKNDRSATRNVYAVDPSASVQYGTIDSIKSNVYNQGASSNIASIRSTSNTMLGDYSNYNNVIPPSNNYVDISKRSDLYEKKMNSEVENGRALNINPGLDHKLSTIESTRNSGNGIGYNSSLDVIESTNILSNDYVGKEKNSILIYIDSPKCNGYFEKNDIHRVFERFGSVKSIMILDSLYMNDTRHSIISSAIKLGSMFAVKAAISALDNIQLANIGRLRCVPLIKDIPLFANSSIIPLQSSNNIVINRGKNLANVNQTNYKPPIPMYESMDTMNHNIINMQDQYNRNVQQLPIAHNKPIQNNILMIFQAPNPPIEIINIMNLFCRFELVDIFDRHPEFDVPQQILGPNASHISHILDNIVSNNNKTMGINVNIILSGIPDNNLPPAQRLHIGLNVNGNEVLYDEMNCVFQNIIRMITDLLDSIYQRYIKFTKLDNNQSIVKKWLRHDYRYQNNSYGYIGIGTQKIYPEVQTSQINDIQILMPNNVMNRDQMLTQNNVMNIDQMISQNNVMNRDQMISQNTVMNRDQMISQNTVMNRDQMISQNNVINRELNTSSNIGIDQYYNTKNRNPDRYQQRNLRNENRRRNKEDRNKKLIAPYRQYNEK